MSYCTSNNFWRLILKMELYDIHDLFFDLPVRMYIVPKSAGTMLMIVKSTDSLTWQMFSMYLRF